MNTRFSMILVGIEIERATALFSAAERELRAMERTMSRFDPEASVSYLNRRAPQQATRPTEELWEILSLCRTYWQRTSGAFDITLWPLNQLWREHLRRGERPTEKAIKQARHQTGFDQIRFDENARTIHFANKGLSIDLGGFGKGFALERLADNLRKRGVDKAFLSFGESSVTVLGSHPHGPAWPVGIANIFPPHNAVHTFHLQNASISTSGTAPFNRAEEQVPGQNIFGQIRIFGQIIDPRSGNPLPGYRTLSVASPSGTDAEVLSTALLVTPLQDRARILSTFPQTSAIEIIYDLNAEEFVPRIEWQYGF
jgi:thiamine biosynthesis lipoprotein